MSLMDKFRGKKDAQEGEPIAEPSQYAHALDAERMLEAISRPAGAVPRDVSFSATDWMSPTWQRIKAHAEQRLARLRVANDEPTKSDAETAVLRGQIKELKLLLRLPESAPAPQTDDA